MRQRMGAATALALALVLLAHGGSEARRDHGYAHGSMEGDIPCAACHTPQRGSSTLPAWSTPNAPQQRFGVDQASVERPRGSQACLSCHDGTVGPLHLARHTELGSYQPGYDAYAGHPVGVRYDSALAASNRDLRDPSLTESGLGGSIASDMLVSGRIECVSCHGVHGGEPTWNLLVKSNARSALCLTCHSK